MEPTSSAMVAQYSNTKYDWVFNIHRAQKDDEEINKPNLQSD
jgi:hypothetical protein